MRSRLLKKWRPVGCRLNLGWLFHPCIAPALASAMHPTNAPKGARTSLTVPLQHEAAAAPVPYLTCGDQAPLGGAGCCGAAQQTAVRWLERTVLPVRQQRL